MELSLQEIHELLEGCKNNHRKAQQRFYEWLKVYAVNTCYRYASNQQDLEELVSEGFIKVYKNIHLYDASLYGLSEASFKGWFKRVLINNCIDWLRKKHPPVSQFSELELVDRADKTANALDQLSYKEIIEAVRELSPIYRTVFNLFVIEGHTHEEIGSMLGISVGTSKSNLFKAREALRAILKKNLIAKHMPEAWNDDIERLGRQAAEHYQADAAAPDWQLIEQKLDLVMPVEKKKRRRAIFFWLFAGIGLFIAYGIYEMNQPEVPPVSKPTAIRPAEEQKIKAAESDKNSNTISTKAGNNSAPVSTPTLPNVQQIRKETTTKKSFAFYTQTSKTPFAQTTTVLPDNTSIQTATAAITNTQNTSARTDDGMLTAQSNRTEQKQLIAAQQTDSSTTDSSVKTNNANTRILLTDSSTASTKQESPKTTRKNPSKWEIGLIYGMDASTVKFKFWEQPGTNAGIVVGIPLNNRWSIRTGAIITRKQYKVAGEDYTLKAYWPNTKLHWVNGFCDMWEIPIQIKYTAQPEQKMSWFATAGLSSYFMKNENYNYYVSVNNGQPYIRHAAYDTSRNYPMGIASFSVGFRARMHERLFFEVEPFARLPLGGVGYGNIKLMSLGVYTSLIIRPFNQSKKH